MPPPGLTIRGILRRNAVQDISLGGRSLTGGCWNCSGQTRCSFRGRSGRSGGCGSGTGCSPDADPTVYNLGILEGFLLERRNASDYPQELLNLFDLYVHGDIDRRGFLDGAQKFAIGGMTATALFESLRPNYAWAQQVPKDDTRIKTESATVPSPQGNGTIKGYLVRRRTRSGKSPGVIVIHENRGLNPYIEDVARRLGTANFVAFAPDGLTSVGGYPGDDEKGGALFGKVDRPKMVEDFVAAAKWLKARPDCTGKIGVVGFCFGGGVANYAGGAHAGPGRGRALLWRRAGGGDVAKIKAAMLVHYGGSDTRLAAHGRRMKRRSRRTTCGTRATSTKANHGFHNDTTPRYDEKAAKLAWQRTLDYFNKYLR